MRGNGNRVYLLIKIESEEDFWLYAVVREGGFVHFDLWCCVFAIFGKEGARSSGGYGLLVSHVLHFLSFHQGFAFSVHLYTTFTSIRDESFGASLLLMSFEFRKLESN